jgi:hypothetical protein
MDMKQDKEKLLAELNHARIQVARIEGAILYIEENMAEEAKKDELSKLEESKKEVNEVDVSKQPNRKK